MRAVVIAGVDVVHTGRDGFAQDGQCRLAIPGRPKDAGAGQPHRTVAEALYEQVAEAECTGALNTGHGSRLQPFDEKHADGIQRLCGRIDRSDAADKSTSHPNIKPRVDISGNGTLDVSSRIIEQVLAWFASRRNLASGEMLDKNGTSRGCR